MLYTEDVTFEERERSLPQWAQRKLERARQAAASATLYRERVNELVDQLAELREEMARGLSKPDSNTFLLDEDANEIGLGNSPTVYFRGEPGKGQVSWGYEVTLRPDGKLHVEPNGPVSITTTMDSAILIDLSDY